MKKLCLFVALALVASWIQSAEITIRPYGHFFFAKIFPCKNTHIKTFIVYPGGKEKINVGKLTHIPIKNKNGVVYKNAQIVYVSRIGIKFQFDEGWGLISRAKLRYSQLHPDTLKYFCLSFKEAKEIEGASFLEYRKMVSDEEMAKIIERLRQMLFFFDDEGNPRVIHAKYGSRGEKEMIIPFGMFRKSDKDEEISPSNITESVKETIFQLEDRSKVPSIDDVSVVEIKYEKADAYVKYQKYIKFAAFAELIKHMINKEKKYIPNARVDKLVNICKNFVNSMSGWELESFAYIYLEVAKHNLNTEQPYKFLLARELLEKSLSYNPKQPMTEAILQMIEPNAIKDKVEKKVDKALKIGMVE